MTEELKNLSSCQVVGEQKDLLLGLRMEPRALLQILGNRSRI